MASENVRRIARWMRHSSLSIGIAGGVEEVDLFWNEGVGDEALAMMALCTALSVIAKHCVVDGKCFECGEEMPCDCRVGQLMELREHLLPDGDSERAT